MVDRLNAWYDRLPDSTRALVYFGPLIALLLAGFVWPVMQTIVWVLLVSVGGIRVWSMLKRRAP